MYVLTNERASWGLQPVYGCNQEFAYHVDADLFILPSSVHEIILMPVRT